MHVRRSACQTWWRGAAPAVWANPYALRPLTRCHKSRCHSAPTPRWRVLTLWCSGVSASHLDLELHDVAAGGCAHKARPHVGVCLVEGAHVAGLLVVVNHVLVIPTARGCGCRKRRQQRVAQPGCTPGEHREATTTTLLVLRATAACLPRVHRRMSSATRALSCVVAYVTVGAQSTAVRTSAPVAAFASATWLACVPHARERQARPGGALCGVWWASC